MSNVSSASTPREIDEHLASLHSERQRLSAQVDSDATSFYHIAGARRQYYGRSLEYNMSFQEAEEKVHKLADGDETYRGHDAQKAIERLTVSRAELAAKKVEIEQTDKLYIGWSRFFVVTSSQGHIHSSMFCSSCYDTTTYGWLPQLSGKNEADAVEACGPALCSVCFPTAPVEHQGGKISTDDAQRLANGATMAELKAEREAAKQAKADAKAEKARKAAIRAQRLMGKVEAFYAANGGFEAVMARPLFQGPDAVYGLTRLSGLQTTVADVIHDDHREFHGERRYGKNPRGVIAEAAR